MCFDLCCANTRSQTPSSQPLWLSNPDWAFPVADKYCPTFQLQTLLDHLESPQMPIRLQKEVRRVVSLQKRVQTVPRLAKLQPPRKPRSHKNLM